MELDRTEASPMKAVVHELDLLRKNFKDSVASYVGKVESEIDIIRQAVMQEQLNGEVDPAKVRDLRDMLSLLSRMSLKPEKGRRKDIRKVDATLEDLRSIVESW